MKYRKIAAGAPRAVARRRAAETWKMTSVKLIWLSDLNYRFETSAEVSLYTALRTPPSNNHSPRRIRYRGLAPSSSSSLSSYHHRSHQRDDHISYAVFVGRPKSKALTRNVRWTVASIFIKPVIYQWRTPSRNVLLRYPPRKYIGFTAYRVFTFLFNIMRCYLSRFRC